jgi:hypothetical protein
LSGFEADEIFHQQLGVTAELPTLEHLTFIISLGNTEADIQQLVQAFTTISQDNYCPKCVAPLQNLLQKWKAELLFVHPSRLSFLRSSPP